MASSGAGVGVVGSGWSPRVGAGPQQTSGSIQREGPLCSQCGETWNKRAGLGLRRRVELLGKWHSKPRFEAFFHFMFLCAFHFVWPPARYGAVGRGGERSLLGQSRWAIHY